jgi:integrase
MGRPRLPPGTYGEIKARRLSSGKWEARAQWRGDGGKMHRPSAVGDTETAAKNALRKKLKSWVEKAAAGEISPETPFATIAEWWLAEIQREADKRVRSPQTPRLYRGWLANHILPALGELTCRELEPKVTRIDAVIRQVHDSLSFDSARTVRTVLSGVCGYAVRHGAMKQNPVRSAARLAQAPGEVKVVQALSDDQRADLMAAIRTYAETKTRDSKGRRTGHRVLVWRDLPELVEAMLATGVRIGEVLALSDADVVKLDDGRTGVNVNAHIVRVPGEGLERLPGRKGGRPGLVLIAPAWSVPMLTRRKLAAPAGGPLFASLSGTWLDPSNTGNRIKDAINGKGLDDPDWPDLSWVTPHVFRKTVSDDLDQAGLSQSEIANQLGNTVAVVEKHYRKKRPTNQRAADALDQRAPRRANEK